VGGATNKKRDAPYGVAPLFWFRAVLESCEKCGLDFRRVGRAANVLAAYVVGEGLRDGGFDSCSFLLKAEAVAEEHGGAEHGTDRVRDALARDVRSRAVDRLLEAHLAFAQ